MAGYATTVLLFLVVVVFSAGTPSVRAVATYHYEFVDDPFHCKWFFRDTVNLYRLPISPRENPCITHSDVELPGGTVRGEWQSTTGVHGPFCFASFLRIPYAQPPVGDRRFKAPITPPSRWSDYKALQKPPAFCPHFTFPARQLVGDEDCLYLNVYTTHPAVMGSESLPVMVYIHGGGFTFGSGDIKELGPHFLVSNNIVLVTFNYRLGPLGFLSMDTEDLPGNNGLKDQQAALLWVKENIHLFGGDPNKMTIFGNSAGAASCHYHTLNEKSNSLISGAILESGTAIASWAYTEDHVRRARLLANNFGAAPNASPDQISRLLQSVKALDLIVGAANISRTDPLLKVSSVPPFVPSPEKRKMSPNSAQPIFMDRDPEYQMLTLPVDPVPMIVGINKDEGIFAYHYTGLAANPLAAEIINQHFQLLLPPTLIPSADTAQKYGVSKTVDPVKLTVAAKTVREAYNHDGRFDVKNQTIFIKYLGDIFTINDVHRLATLYQFHNKKVPLYLYLFDVEGEFNLGRKTLSISTPGVVHTDELGYLFRITKPDLHQDPVSDSISSGTLRFLTSTWTEFARTQSPTSLYLQSWQSVEGPPSQEKPFTHIGVDHLGLVELTMPEPWDRLYTMFRTSKANSETGNKPSVLSS